MIMVYKSKRDIFCVSLQSQNNIYHLNIEFLFTLSSGSIVIQVYDTLRGPFSNTDGENSMIIIGGY